MFKPKILCTPVSHKLYYLYKAPIKVLINVLSIHGLPILSCSRITLNIVFMSLILCLRAYRKLLVLKLSSCNSKAAETPSNPFVEVFIISIRNIKAPANIIW